MSRTRNQRRRDRLIERILRIASIALLLVTLGMLAKQCADLEALQEEINSRQQVPVVTAADYLPENFNEEAYQAALQRYNAENGLIIPEQKEAAPELAGSEAGDTENSAS